MFASLYLLIYPLATKVDPSAEYETPLTLVSTAVRALGQVLPGALSIWIDAYARDPSHFLMLGILVVALILFGVMLGGRIEDNMERVWRKFDPAQRSIGQIVGGLAVTGAVVFVVGYSYLPAHWAVTEFLQAHITDPVRAILICTLPALYTPRWIVMHLRNATPYRFVVRSIKLFILPLFFAASFYGIALLFGTHLAFSIEDSFGMVCPTSKNIAEKSDADKPNQGLEACPPATVASCHTGQPTCTNNRVVSCLEGTPSCEKRDRPRAQCDPLKRNCEYRVPVCKTAASSPASGTNPPAPQATGFAICPSICEIRPNAVDLKDKKIDAILSTNSVCKGTGIWVEQGQKYRIKIAAPGPGSGNAWKDGDIPVSTRGVDSSNLSFIDRIWQVVLWPLKRHLFIEPFKVVARVGSTGSDERVLEPDENLKTNSIDAIITPNRDGELFLYVNGPVWAWNWEQFYNAHKGSATIEVSRAND